MAHQLIAAWAEELSRQLGRAPAELVQRGLAAEDFRDDVELTFPDGSRAYFRHAFFVANAARQQIAVFTEHCGYHVFPYTDTEIWTIRKTYFIGQ